MESTRDLYVPDGEEDMDVFQVVNYSLTEEGGAGDMVRRDAQLTVVADERLIELFRDNPVVQFRGTRYVLGGAEYPALVGHQEPVSPLIVVSLTGVA